MNTERLHTIAASLRKDIANSNVIANLQSLVSSLQDQISQPSQPQYQERTGQLRSELQQALESAEINYYSPTCLQALDELGATKVFGASLATRIDEVFSRNLITPSVAQQELQVMLNEVQMLSNALDQILAGFKSLHVGMEELQQGECELGVIGGVS